MVNILNKDKKLRRHSKHSSYLVVETTLGGHTQALYVQALSDFLQAFSDRFTYCLLGTGTVWGKNRTYMIVKGNRILSCSVPFSAGVPVPSLHPILIGLSAATWRNSTNIFLHSDVTGLVLFNWLKKRYLWISALWPNRIFHLDLTPCLEWGSILTGWSDRIFRTHWRNRVIYPHGIFMIIFNVELAEQHDISSLPDLTVFIRVREQKSVMCPHPDLIPPCVERKNKLFYKRRKWDLITQTRLCTRHPSPYPEWDLTLAFNCTLCRFEGKPSHSCFFLSPAMRVHSPINYLPHKAMTIMISRYNVLLDQQRDVVVAFWTWCLLHLWG
jgi:hypothetical protein